MTKSPEFYIVAMHSGIEMETCGPLSEEAKDRKLKDLAEFVDHEETFFLVVESPGHVNDFGETQLGFDMLYPEDILQQDERSRNEDEETYG